jgi:hypothetical protein
MRCIGVRNGVLTKNCAHLPSVQRSAAEKDAQHDHAALLGASVATAVLPMLEHGSESMMPAVLHWVNWYKMS